MDLTEFQPLKDFENWYLINKKGEIYSLWYKRLIKQQIDTNGYLKVVLTNDIKNNNKRSVHRLLAIQYIPNPNNLPQVDHIDNYKLNNNIENLEWVSIANNCNNRLSSLCKEGCIFSWYSKPNNKYYWRAEFYINGKSIKKNSINKSVCEEWLDKIKNEYIISL